MFAFTMSLRQDKQHSFVSNTLLLTRQFLTKQELKEGIKFHFDEFFKKESKPEYINSIYKRLVRSLKIDFSEKKFQVYAVDPTMVFTFQRVKDKSEIENFNLASFIDVTQIDEMPI